MHSAPTLPFNLDLERYRRAKAMNQMRIVRIVPRQVAAQYSIGYALKTNTMSMVILTTDRIRTKKQIDRISRP